jgi:hypothetical protein
MTQVTVQIKDQDMPDLLAWLQARGYGVEEGVEEIPTWQQDLVNERIKNSTPDTATDAEVVLERVFAPYRL